MQEIVKIENKNLVVKEYNNQRVVTLWDIAELHDRTASEVGQQFKRNNRYLIENVDYYLISKEKISESQIVIQNKVPNNVKNISIFTESGYLMLVKSFNDEMSWKIQRILINSYFKLKDLYQEFKVPKTFKEALILAVEQQERIELLEIENSKKEEILIEQKPKVDYYNVVTNTNKSISIGEVAKLINFKSLENKSIRRNILFKILRDNKILDSYNIPYQNYIKQKYFEVVQKYNTDINKIQYTSLVTSKGIDYIIQLLRKLNYIENIDKYMNLKCTKKKFSKFEAMLSIYKAEYIRKRRHNNTKRKEIRYYYCKECKCYHLTSQKRRENDL